MEVRRGESTDLAFFRSEKATIVTADDRSTTGTAALFRKPSGKSEGSYVTGR